MTLTKNENGYYEFKIKTKEGKYRTFSTKKKTKAAAEKVIADSKIAEIEKAAELGVLSAQVISVLTTGKRMSVAQAIEPWVEWMRGQHYSANYVTAAANWVLSWARDRHLSNKPIVSVKQADIDDWVNDRDSTATMGTRHVKHMALVAFFSYAANLGMVLGNPARLVRLDKSILTHEQKEPKKKLLLYEEEIQMLLNATAPGAVREDTFWHAAIAISRYTGLRLSDIAALEWASISEDAITVWTVKRDKRVQLKLEPEVLRNAIATVPREDDTYLFPAQREIAISPTRRALLSVNFSRLVSEFGIRATFHTLRSSYIVACKEAGITMEHIADRVGHSSTVTTEGYLPR